MGTTRQQVLIDTFAARQRAAELLKTLEQAQCECEGCMKADQRTDAMKIVTGKSSIEQAISQTRRMMEMLDRALEEARSGAGQDAIEDAKIEVVARIGPGMAGRAAGGR